MKTKLLRLFSIIFIFSLFSCSNLFEQVDVKNSSSDVSVSFNFGNSRAIVSTAEPEKYKYTLDGTIGEETKKLCDKIAYSEFISKNFEVSKGEWTFKITAWDNDKAVYSDEKSVNLTSSKTTVSFTLKALTGGSGSVSIKLTYDQSADVKKVTAGIYDDLFAADTGSQLTIDTSDFSATFTADSIPSGVNKFVRFFLYDSQNVCIGSYVESIFIANGDSITVTRNVAVNSYSAVVYVKVQGKVWNDSGCKIKALKDGKSYEFLTTAGTNVYTASLPVGTYDIYNDSEDTGKTLTVDGNSTAKATVDFDTVTVYATVENIAEVVSGLISVATVIVTGDFDSNDISVIKSAIYNTGYTIKLDLSNSTKLESIPNNAFNHCSNLTAVILPECIKNIGQYAFQYCSKLSNINLPASVTSIGKNAFASCSTLSSISLPTGLQKIEDASFASTGLTSIVIPEGVTSIGETAFVNCQNLSSVSVPASVNTIKPRAFTNCKQLQTISIDENNEYFSYSDGVLFNKDKTILIAYLKDTRDSYDIPNTVSKIEDNAFKGSMNLRSVLIPSSVTTIGEECFHGCYNLSSFSIPSSVKEIGEWAFANTAITSVVIPSSVTYINMFVFRSCSCLTSVTIPSTVTYISNGAFDYSGLTELTIPSSVKGLGWGCFKGCKDLKTLTILPGMTSIVDNAFEDCTSLSSVTIPDTVTRIGSASFEGCSSLKSITIPSSVNSIQNNSFIDCKSLENVSLKSTSDYFLSENGILYNKDKTKIICYPVGNKNTSYSIPDTVQVLNEGIFRGCEALQSVTVPASVTIINSSSFSGCKNLSMITFENPLNWYHKIWYQSEQDEICSDLSDPAVNATYFTETYAGHNWEQRSN